MRKMQYKHVPQPRKSRGSNKYEKSTRFVAAGCICLSANLAANKMERQNCKWKALIKLQVICIKCSDEKNHKNCCRSRAAHPLTTIQLQLYRKKKTAVRQWKTLASAVATTTNLRNWRPKPNKTKQNERKIKEKNTILSYILSLFLFHAQWNVLMMPATVGCGCGSDWGGLNIRQQQRKLAEALQPQKWVQKYCDQSRVERIWIVLEN